MSPPTPWSAGCNEPQTKSAAKTLVDEVRCGSLSWDPRANYVSWPPSTGLWLGKSFDWARGKPHLLALPGRGLRRGGTPARLCKRVCRRDQNGKAPQMF